MCISFPEPWAWIPVWGDLRLSAGSTSCFAYKSFRLHLHWGWFAYMINWGCFSDTNFIQVMVEYKYIGVN